MSTIKLVRLTLLSLWIGMAMVGGQSVWAAANQPPDGAEEFAARQFHQIVEEIVFSDRPGEWGFEEDMGTITFSDLYPVYSLNADFARGRSDDLIADRHPKWVAVIYQDDRPVNAIGTQRTADGHFALDAVGYPPELPSGLLNLQDSDILIHDFPAEEYYVYSENTDSIMKLELTNQESGLHVSQSKEQFQNMLVERYRYIDEWEEDASGGFMQATLRQSSFLPSSVFLYPAAIILVLVSAWLYYRRRLKTQV